jgi:hypothetical protein
MILRTVVLHHGRDFLEAFVAHEGTAHRIELEWHEPNHVLQADWFKTVAGEVLEQREQRRLRALGKAPL